MILAQEPGQITAASSPIGGGAMSPNGLLMSPIALSRHEQKRSSQRERKLTAEVFLVPRR